MIVVSRLGHSTRDAARRLKEQLGLLDAPLMGVVANFVSPCAGYFGDYGYARYTATSPDEGRGQELTKA